MGSYMGLSCLTLNLHINFFPSDSLVKKKKKADDKCRLKFGTESVKGA